MFAGSSVQPSQHETLTRVTAALREDNVELATRLATQALAFGMEHPLFLNLRAFRLEREGRDAEALSDLRKAARLAPRDATILNALGLASARCGYLDDAIDAFEAAIAEQPDFSQAHFNNGWVREEAGDLAAAKRCYMRAHETQPDAAEPLGRLAGLSLRRGAFSEARDYAERALVRDRYNASAVLVLGKLDIEQGAFCQAESRLRAFLNCPA